MLPNDCIHLRGLELCSSFACDRNSHSVQHFWNTSLHGVEVLSFEIIFHIPYVSWMWCLVSWVYTVGAPFIWNGSLIITCVCVCGLLHLCHPCIVSFENIFENSCNLVWTPHTLHFLTNAFFRAGQRPASMIQYTVQFIPNRQGEWM